MNFYWQYIQSFIKIAALLSKITHNCSKAINEYEVGMGKKMLSKRKKNLNKTNVFLLNAKITFIKLKIAFIIAYILCHLD